MPLPEITGRLDPTLGYIVPVSTSSTWSSLSSSTWATFQSWAGSTANPLVWASNRADLGEVIDFTVTVTASYSGTIDYDIYVSSTGYFRGEETVFSITEGTTSIPSFRGRYVIVVSKIYKTGETNVLKSFSFTTARKILEINLFDVDTSQLAGSVEGRVLPLGRSVSKVLGVFLEGRDIRDNSYTVDDYIDVDYFTASGGGYFTSDYITEGYTISSYNTMVWPFLVSKSNTGPVVCLRNEYGDYVDGQIDAVVKVLPEQYMLNGQLLTR